MSQPSPRRNLRRVALATLALAVVALLAMLWWRGRGDRAGTAEAAPAPATPPGFVAPPVRPAPRPLIVVDTPVQEQVRAEIGAFVAGYLESMASGDREAIRRHWNGPAMLSDALVEVEPDGDPADKGIELVRLTVTDENIRNHQDGMLDTILDVPADERADWADKAEVRDLIPLEDGRYFVRLWADGVTRRPPSGRQTGLATREFGPDDRVEMEKDQRMVVARGDGGWKIVAFPRLDRQPPVD